MQHKEPPDSQSQYVKELSPWSEAGFGLHPLLKVNSQVWPLHCGRVRMLNVTLPASNSTPDRMNSGWKTFQNIHLRAADIFSSFTSFNAHICLIKWSFLQSFSFHWIELQCRQFIRHRLRNQISVVLLVQRIFLAASEQQTRTFPISPPEFIPSLSPTTSLVQQLLVQSEY